MSEADFIACAGERFASVELLISNLASLGVAPGSVVLVYSSLSALGWVCGGPVAVIEALLINRGRQRDTSDAHPHRRCVRSFTLGKSRRALRLVAADQRVDAPI
jgi:hypothetical protein